MTIPTWVYRPLTPYEQCVMRSIRRIAIIFAILIGLVATMSGCATRPGWGVVNNTGYRVVVTQDGKIAAHLQPGQTVELISTAWREPSLVNVVAYDAFTNYVGVNTYTFSRFAPYNWQVDHVFKPEGAR